MRIIQKVGSVSMEAILLMLSSCASIHRHPALYGMARGTVVGVIKPVEAILVSLACRGRAPAKVKTGRSWVQAGGGEHFAVCIYHPYPGLTRLFLHL